MRGGRKSVAIATEADQERAIQADIPVVTIQPDLRLALLDHLQHLCEPIS